MRWKGLRRSSNVDDVRGRGPGGAGFRLPIGAKGGGGIGIVVILAIIFFLGGPEAVMQLLGGGTSVSVDQPPGTPGAPSAPSDEAGEFVSAVLGSTEDAWMNIFQGAGADYIPPRLTIFDGAVQSACGFNTSAVGPFYCPPDRRVYLDVAFFRDLARMGGAGDFAQAYVIGHEVGHHVQNLTGTAAQVRQAQSRGGERDANRLQVLMELQADCYAGVWAHHADKEHRLLEPGDVQEGLAAAAAIGDDRMQKNAGRAVTPESFTHGTSAQRQQWLETGLRTGSVDACDTFASL